MNSIKYPRLAIVGLLSSIFFTSAALPIFMISTTTANNLNGVLLLTFCLKILLELPSGYLADKYGKWNVLLIGSVLNLVAGCFFFSTNGLALLACQILLLISSTLYTGATSAYLYELLERTFRLESYLSLEALCQGLYFISWLVIINFSQDNYLSFPYALSIFLIPNTLSLIILLLLPNFSTSSKRPNSATTQDEFWPHISNTISQIVYKKDLTTVILGCSIILGMNQLLKYVFYMPDPLVTPLFDTEEILAVSALLGCLLSPFIMKTQTVRRTYHITAFIALFSAASILITCFDYSPNAAAYMSVIFNCLSYFTLGLVMPAILWVMNNNTSATCRATTISCSFMIKQFTFVFLLNLHQGATFNYVSPIISALLITGIILLFTWQFTLSNLHLLQDYPDSDDPN